jgi:hypothetical protein
MTDYLSRVSPCVAKRSVEARVSLGSQKVPAI